jgi:hypothetical protein
MPEIAQQYKRSKAQYEADAKAWTLRFATG